MTTKPDLAQVYEVVNPKITDAMEKASARLKSLGVRHALIGGLAVGAYGFPRATKDADFLVGSEAFVFHPSGIVSPIPGLPVSVGKIGIDLIPVEDHEGFLDPAIDHPQMSQGIPVTDPDTLVYTKVRSPRPKDRLDLVQMFSSGTISMKSARAFVAKNDSKWLDKLDSIIADAESIDE